RGRSVDDADPAAVMVERSGLSLRHDDNALGRTEQPPVDPVVESVFEVFGRGTMKEAYPGPRRAQLTQQIRQRRRLVAMSLHDGRSRAAQHGSYSQGHAPIDRPAVFHEAGSATGPRAARINASAGATAHAGPLLRRAWRPGVAPAGRADAPTRAKSAAGPPPRRRAVDNPAGARRAADPRASRERRRPVQE